MFLASFNPLSKSGRYLSLSNLYVRKLRLKNVK